MTEKEEIVCEQCSGTGFVLDSSGHSDVCPACFGLGTTLETKEKRPLTKSKSGLRKNVVWTLIGLSIFYAVFFFFYIRGDLGIFATVVILISGHMAAISYIVGYMILKSMQNKA